MSGKIRTIPITEPAAWTRAEMEADQGWILRLSPDHIRALDHAVAGAKARQAPLFRMRREDFPLPGWDGLLADLWRQLTIGRGVALLRGLPIDRYGETDARIAFWGIGSHLGTAVTQNAASELLVGVYDRGQTYAGDVRAYQVSAELALHCDNSDLVGLMCVRQARSGGETLLTSALAIYNRILAEAPEDLPLLHAGFPYDRKGEQGPGEPAVSARIPVFDTAADGTVSARYARSYITRAEARTGIALTGPERAALDRLDRIAGDPSLMLEFHLEPGDIEFANNYTVLHARRAYQDDPAARRLMLRLWLENAALRRVESEALRFGFTRFGNHGRTAQEAGA